MYYIYFYLYNNDIMRCYIKNKEFEKTPQALEINYKGRVYAFSVMNAGVEPVKTEKLQKKPLITRQQHVHPVYHIVLYSDGAAWFAMNGKVYEGSLGTLALTGPGEPHCFCLGSKSDEQVVYRCFSFQLKALDGGDWLSVPFHELMSMYSGMELKNLATPVFLSKRQHDMVSGLIERVAEQLLKEDSFSVFSRSMAILELFNSIVHEFYTHGEEGEGVTELPLARAKDMIEKRYNQKLSIEELAKNASLSPGYFIRAFKKAYKTSPIDYQMELKINAAKSYLLTSELPMKEIASRVGFSDVYYFSKTFKKHLGVPPSVFRKSAVE